MCVWNRACASRLSEGRTVALAYSGRSPCISTSPHSVPGITECNQTLVNSLGCNAALYCHVCVIRRAARSPLVYTRSGTGN